MNRRDALKALGGIAAATGMQVTPVSTRDTEGAELVILKSAGRLSCEQVARLEQVWKDAVVGTSLSDVKTLVLEPGMDIEIVRNKA